MKLKTGSGNTRTTVKEAKTFAKGLEKVWKEQNKDSVKPGTIYFPVIFGANETGNDYNKVTFGPLTGTTTIKYKKLLTPEVTRALMKKNKGEVPTVTEVTAYVDKLFKGENLDSLKKELGISALPHSFIDNRYVFHIPSHYYGTVSEIYENLAKLNSDAVKENAEKWSTDREDYVRDDPSKYGEILSNFQNKGASAKNSAMKKIYLDSVDPFYADKENYELGKKADVVPIPSINKHALSYGILAIGNYLGSLMSKKVSYGFSTVESIEDANRVFDEAVQKMLDGEGSDWYNLNKFKIDKEGKIEEFPVATPIPENSSGLILKVSYPAGGNKNKEILLPITLTSRYKGSAAEQTGVYVFITKVLRENNGISDTLYNKILKEYKSAWKNMVDKKSYSTGVNTKTGEKQGTRVTKASKPRSPLLDEEDEIRSEKKERSKSRGESSERESAKKEIADDLIKELGSSSTTSSRKSASQTTSKPELDIDDFELE